MMKTANELSFKRVLLLLAFCILPIISACGGGMGGSGDGGSSSRTVILPPELSADPLMFRSIPETVLVDLPDSLFDVSDSMASSGSTLHELGNAVSDVNNYKTETALLQLLAESSWLALQTHCDSTPIDTACVFSADQILTTYTNEMASWEYVTKYERYQESLGGESVSNSDVAELTSLIMAKINTERTLGNGTFTAFSTGSYQFELVTNLDLGYGNNIYTLRWTENLDDGFLSIVSADEGNLRAMQVSKTQTSSGLRNAILLTNIDKGIRQETQLNFKRSANEEELQIEAQITQFGTDDKTDIYLLGKADDTGGYVASEQVHRSVNDTVTHRFTRQGFDNNAQLQSLAVCDNNLSVSDCTINNSWQVVLGDNPVNWPFYQSDEELITLQSQLTPFTIDFQNVAADMDSFMLIRREHLSISVTTNGVLVFVPGLGELDVSGELPNQDETSAAGTNEIDEYSDLVDSVLCRVKPSHQNNGSPYRSFCAGTVNEIENAVVIGESFRDGMLRVEWQSNAVIDVIGR